MIVEFQTIRYSEPKPGGTIYPDLDGATALDWIERGMRLVVFLDTDEAGASSIVEANAEFGARVVEASEVDDFVWRDTRSRRAELLDSVEWMRDRHRDEADLVAAGVREATTLTEAQYVELLTYIDSLRAVPNNAAYPAAVEWPEMAEGV